MPGRSVLLEGLPGGGMNSLGKSLLRAIYLTDRSLRLGPNWTVPAPTFYPPPNTPAGQALVEMCGDDFYRKHAKQEAMLDQARQELACEKFYVACIEPLPGEYS